MVSGSQVLKALKYYLVSPHSIDFTEKKKYHKITSIQSSTFINNLKNIRKISFYSALCTELSESNINEYLSGWFLNLGVPAPDIEINAALKIKHSEVVLDENKKVSVKNQKLFKKIIAIDEIKKRFLFDETCLEDRYKDEDKTGTRNLVVRVMSVPKFAYKIFTLQPINTDVTPLFQYIKEHNPKV